MSNENPIGCGVGRACPLFQVLPDQPEGASAQGVCRLTPPNTIPIGGKPGVNPQQPEIVTGRVHRIVSANDVCLFHPALAESFAAKIGAAFLSSLLEAGAALKWARDSGFDRAPTLDEARRFMPPGGGLGGVTPSERASACEHAAHPGMKICYKCGAALGQFALKRNLSVS